MFYWYYLAAFLFVLLAIGLAIVGNESARRDAADYFRTDRKALLKAELICGGLCGMLAALWGFAAPAWLMLVILLAPLMPYAGTQYEVIHLDAEKIRKDAAEKVAFFLAGLTWLIVCVILTFTVTFKGFSPWPDR